MFWLMLAAIAVHGFLVLVCGLLATLVLRRCLLLIYRRLDRLPPRVVATNKYGDEFYRKD